MTQIIMRFDPEQESDNVEDIRGQGGTRRGAGMGRGVGLGGGGIILMLVIGYLSGQNPLQILGSIAEQQLQQGQSQHHPMQPAPGQHTQARPAEENRAAKFISQVLRDTEKTWPNVLAQVGLRYVEPKLVLFTGAVDSACGYHSSAVGPFYCPADQKVYIDLSFFDELSRKFGAPGDFAQAYVVAHEIGHHVQTLSGVSKRIHALRGRVSEEDANQLSVLQELQADCYAGIWAHHAQKERQVLEEGDIEEGLRAASAIGDDKLQKQAQGYVVPESFTHGSSKQRVEWFGRGLQTGSFEACDTLKSLKR